MVLHGDARQMFAARAELREIGRAGEREWPSRNREVTLPRARASGSCRPRRREGKGSRVPVR